MSVHVCIVDVNDRLPLKTKKKHFLVQFFRPQKPKFMNLLQEKSAGFFQSASPDFVVSIHFLRT
jgi:hypothetical protein